MKVTCGYFVVIYKLFFTNKLKVQTEQPQWKENKMGCKRF